MFVGHYGPSFAAKAAKKSIPLWVLFLAVQLLDVFWSIFVLLGIEKVRIVPGITATNPLDLYYMPYTHGLDAAVFWSVAAAFAYRGWRSWSAAEARSELRWRRPPPFAGLGSKASSGATLSSSWQEVLGRWQVWCHLPEAPKSM
jgi:hypothetical protein